MTVKSIGYNVVNDFYHVNENFYFSKLQVRKIQIISFGRHSHVFDVDNRKLECRHGLLSHTFYV